MNDCIDTEDNKDDDDDDNSTVNNVVEQEERTKEFDCDLRERQREK